VIFEAYFKYSRVTQVGRTLWKQFAPIAIGALIALELIQIPIFITLARRLRAAQLQRERLLRHAIQASEAERRRIASDLHDGVVQELTGVSLSLAAASRSDSPDASRMGEASASLRGSIKSLRSLLVEIYPPNLHEEGLEFALGDRQILFDPESVEVTPFIAAHNAGAPAFTLRLASGGKTLVYSGDTAWCDNLVRAADGADLMIVESSGWDKEIPQHLDYGTLSRRRAELKARTIVLTHMGPEMLANRGTVRGFELAEDGKSFEI